MRIIYDVYRGSAGIIRDIYLIWQCYRKRKCTQKYGCDTTKKISDTMNGYRSIWDESIISYTTSSHIC